MEFSVKSTAKPTKGGDLSIPSSPSEEQALAWMGPPPLVPGEDPAKYEYVLRMVAQAMKPVDIVDWFWVRDFTDLEWEVVRLRKIKAFMISREKITKLGTDEDGETCLEAGSNEENLAYGMRHLINTLERLDRMIMALEARRDRVYRESERRGGSVAPLRRAAEQIEDGEFCEIGQEDPVQKRAA
jgi:hypothetical protein